MILPTQISLKNGKQICLKLGTIKEDYPRDTYEKMFTWY